ncbi:hypothetical protein L3Q82_003608 [Scortum barcoo]|uniref:Uncharacterized protein n=1 Tax=Scortum barcoo TaxID=214431 RepID=A0ACB8VN01_9TELE|nr:hypothetical protein L3Q82_003608 [Scortum barcoo]
MFYPKTPGNDTRCFDTTTDIYIEDYLKYSLGWAFTGFCIPFLITLGCYGHVIVVLCHKRAIDKISRGLVCLNSALNPLVYLHGHEEVCAQLRQLLQQALFAAFSADTMNNTTCPRVPFDFTGRFLPPVYILVFIIGLVANGWGLKSLIQKWKKLKIINIFVLNLGLTDVLYLLTLPIFVVYYSMKSKWIFGDAFCKIMRFCFSLNLYGSIGFLTCISVYRYLAIVHPVRVMGRLTRTHSVVISVVVWLLVGVQSLPDMFYPKTPGNDTRCFDTTTDIYIEDYLKYSLGWAFTGFCIPFLITLGCYGHVIVVLCHKRAIDKNLNLWTRVLLNQRQCRKWFDGVYIAHQISRGLVCLNSALNPLVYLHGHEEVCAQLRQLLQQASDTMNNTTCPRVPFDFTIRFLPPVYILVFIIGLVANGWGLKSLIQKWKKLKIINVFVLNLGLTDVLYLLTLPFLTVYYFMDSKWIFGDAFCKITRFCFSLNLYGSIGFLTCISVYRYLAIVHPMRVMGRLTRTHSVVISVMVWLLVGVQSLPDMFYPKAPGHKPGK